MKTNTQLLYICAMCVWIDQVPHVQCYHNMKGLHRYLLVTRWLPCSQSQYSMMSWAVLWHKDHILSERTLAQDPAVHTTLASSDLLGVLYWSPVQACPRGLQSVWPAPFTVTHPSTEASRRGMAPWDQLQTCNNKTALDHLWAIVFSKVVSRGVSLQGRESTWVAWTN